MWYREAQTSTYSFSPWTTASCQMHLTFLQTQSRLLHEKRASEQNILEFTGFWCSDTGWPPPAGRSSPKQLPLSLCLPAVCSLQINKGNQLNASQQSFKRSCLRHTFSPTCFLGSVRPRGDVNIHLRADRKKKAQWWDVGWKTCVFIPWTCSADSGAAWLWWTGRWAWPCCSGGWWVWTQCPRCSRHHWPANQASSLRRGLTSEGTGHLFSVNLTKGVEELPTFTRTCSTTLSSSRERGCSGSLMVLIRCYIS